MKNLFYLIMKIEFFIYLIGFFILEIKTKFIPYLNIDYYNNIFSLDNFILTITLFILIKKQKIIINFKKNFFIKKSSIFMAIFMGLGITILLEFFNSSISYNSSETKIMTNALIFSPILEEFFFRGYIFKKLKNRYSINKSFLYTGILFLMMHSIFNVPLLLLSCFIFYPTYIYYKHESLLNNICFHATYNFIIYINIFISIRNFNGTPFLLNMITNNNKSIIYTIIISLFFIFISIYYYIFNLTCAKK